MNQSASNETPPNVEVKKAPSASQPEWIDAANTPIAENWKTSLSNKILQIKTYGPDLTIWVSSGDLLETCNILKNKGYDFLVDIIGIHQPKAQKPLCLSYIFHNMQTNERLRIKVELDENEEVNSVSSIWKTANWMEREVYDMVGIKIKNHPNLERILLWEGFDGHPLRKDFPILGKTTGAILDPDVFPTGGGPVKKKEPASV